LKRRFAARWWAAKQATLRLWGPMQVKVETGVLS